MMDSGRRRPSTATASRLARGWRLDRNPLRRASDRVESLMLIALLAVFLASAPLAALACGGWAHTAAQRAELAQAASRRLVTAVVATAPAVGDIGFGGTASVSQARWTAPDGKVVKQEIPVSVGTRPGATLQVWSTLDGQLTSHPMSAAQVSGCTALGEATGAAAAATALALVGLLAHWALVRRRMSAWDADWQATGPRWTTRT
jgi:hypothetical protein